jgi:hypothetical protein
VPKIILNAWICEVKLGIVFFELSLEMKDMVL